MIENQVDKAFASLLSTIDGLTVVAGMEDNEGLTTPYCVVYSNVQDTLGKNAIYKLLTVIEYVSISGPNAVADVASAMTAIDAVLTTQATGALLTAQRATLAALGLVDCQWEHIPKTQQEVGDRRRNLRELIVYAKLT